MNNENKNLINTWLVKLNDVGGEFHLARIYTKETGIDVSNYRDSEFNLLKSILYNHGLVKKNPQGTFDTGELLTSLGKDIAESGGWDLYFKKQEEIKQFIEEDRKLTRQLAKSTLVLNRITIIVSFITLSIALFAVWVNYKQMKISEEELKQSMISNLK